VVGCRDGVDGTHRLLEGAVTCDGTGGDDDKYVSISSSGNGEAEDREAVEAMVVSLLKEGE
jgi:hypothetical protein